MTSGRTVELPPVPTSVETVTGHPAFGTYRGELSEVSLKRLAGPYHVSWPARLLKHKRWQYALVATQEVLGLFTIADLSYSANAFAVAVDLREKKALFDGSYMGLSGPMARVNDRPGEGLSASFRTVGARFSCERVADRERYKLDLDIRGVPFVRGGLRWRGDILAAGGPPALTVISPIRGDGVVNVTQKWAGLLGFGTLSAGGKTYVLDGGVAGLDYTQGYMARRTAWRWALGVGRFPDGTPVGLNLVEGFNDHVEEANENALWVGSRLIPLPRVQFSFSAQDYLDEWRIQTADKTLDLRFRPFHVHREERDYKLVKSHFVQPVGTFEGTVVLDGRPVRLELSGVTEDQDILW